MVAKKGEFRENFCIVSGRLYFRYRFYRKTFTPLMRGIVAGVFVCLCAISFLFSPERSAHSAFASVPALPSVAVGEAMSDEDELFDSSPLFLPTRWNALESDLESVLSVRDDLELGFKGVFFLDEKLKEFKPTEALAEAEDTFDLSDFWRMVDRWELTRSFGERRSGELPTRAKGVRMEVFDCSKGKRIFLGTVDAANFRDEKRLLESVEIECYGDAAFRHFAVTNRSGSSDVDAAVERFVRVWSAKYLREPGRYRFRVGE